MAKPSHRTIRTSVMLPKDMYAQMQAIVQANDVSAAWMIRQTILKLLVQQHGQRSRA